MSGEERATAPPTKHATATAGERATNPGSRSLWFTASLADDDRRPPLTRERVVAQALTVIADDGVEALTMRTLAARLGVVPGALYRHVRNKQQLYDLVLDGVLAEVDTDVDPALPWTQRLKVLAHRLREVLDDHPGVAALLKTRDPLGPHSLALAEAFLAPLHTAGFPHRDAGLAFFLITDYTIGFAVSPTRTSANEQRVRDTATRTQLHEFFRTLPPTASPPWSPSASTSGSTTTTSASPPASTPSSTGSNAHDERPTDAPSGPTHHHPTTCSTPAPGWTSDPRRDDPTTRSASVRGSPTPAAHAPRPRRWRRHRIVGPGPGGRAAVRYRRHRGSRHSLKRTASSEPLVAFPAL